MSYSLMHLAFSFRSTLEIGKNPYLDEISYFTRILEEEFFGPESYKNVLHIQTQK